MEITAAQVKELREKSGAGIMDCKEALVETDGDIEKAFDSLRKKGIAAAQKRIGRATSEGAVESYIHPGSRLGVLVEVNCESDFVAKTKEFKEFVKDMAMQIAATNPLAVTREGLDQAVVEKEKEIYRLQAKELNKPEHVTEKIVEGKVEKYCQEVCLMEQQFIKDTNKSVNDVLMGTIGKIGENISIKRFSRFRLGEDA